MPFEESYRDVELELQNFERKMTGVYKAYFNPTNYGFSIESHFCGIATLDLQASKNPVDALQQKLNLLKTDYERLDPAKKRQAQDKFNTLNTRLQAVNESLEQLTTAVSKNEVLARDHKTDQELIGSLLKGTTSKVSIMMGVCNQISSSIIELPSISSSRTELATKSRAQTDASTTLKSSTSKKTNFATELFSKAKGSIKKSKRRSQRLSQAQLSRRGSETKKTRTAMDDFRDQLSKYHNNSEVRHYTGAYFTIQASNPPATEAQLLQAHQAMTEENRAKAVTQLQIVIDFGKYLLNKDKSISPNLIFNFIRPEAKILGMDIDAIEKSLKENVTVSTSPATRVQAASPTSLASTRQPAILPTESSVRPLRPAAIQQKNTVMIIAYRDLYREKQTVSSLVDAVYKFATTANTVDALKALTANIEAAEKEFLHVKATVEKAIAEDPNSELHYKRLIDADEKVLKFARQKVEFHKWDSSPKDTRASIRPPDPLTSSLPQKPEKPAPLTPTQQLQLINLKKRLIQDFLDDYKKNDVCRTFFAAYNNIVGGKGTDSDKEVLINNLEAVKREFRSGPKYRVEAESEKNPQFKLQFEELIKDDQINLDTAEKLVEQLKSGQSIQHITETQEFKIIKQADLSSPAISLVPDQPRSIHPTQSVSESQRLNFELYTQCNESLNKLFHLVDEHKKLIENDELAIKSRKQESRTSIVRDLITIHSGLAINKNNPTAISIETYKTWLAQLEERHARLQTFVNEEKAARNLPQSSTTNPKILEFRASDEYKKFKAALISAQDADANTGKTYIVNEKKERAQQLQSTLQTAKTRIEELEQFVLARREIDTEVTNRLNENNIRQLKDELEAARKLTEKYEVYLQPFPLRTYRGSITEENQPPRVVSVYTNSTEQSAPMTPTQTEDLGNKQGNQAREPEILVQGVSTNAEQERADASKKQAVKLVQDALDRYVAVAKEWATEVDSTNIDNEIKQQARNRISNALTSVSSLISNFKQGPATVENATIAVEAINKQYNNIKVETLMWPIRKAKYQFDTSIQELQRKVDEIQDENTRDSLNSAIKLSIAKIDQGIINNERALMNAVEHNMDLQVVKDTIIKQRQTLMSEILAELSTAVNKAAVIPEVTRSAQPSAIISSDVGDVVVSPARSQVPVSSSDSNRVVVQPPSTSSLPATAQLPVSVVATPLEPSAPAPSTAAPTPVSDVNLERIKQNRDLGNAFMNEIHANLRPPFFTLFRDSWKVNKIIELASTVTSQENKPEPWKVDLLHWELDSYLRDHPSVEKQFQARLAGTHPEALKNFLDYRETQDKLRKGSPDQQDRATRQEWDNYCNDIRKDLNRWFEKDETKAWKVNLQLDKAKNSALPKWQRRAIYETVQDYLSANDSVNNIFKSYSQKVSLHQGRAAYAKFQENPHTLRPTVKGLFSPVVLPTIIPSQPQYDFIPPTTIPKAKTVPVTPSSLSVFANTSASSISKGGETQEVLRQDPPIIDDDTLEAYKKLEAEDEAAAKAKQGMAPQTPPAPTASAQSSSTAKPSVSTRIITSKSNQTHKAEPLPPIPHSKSGFFKAPGTTVHLPSTDTTRSDRGEPPSTSPHSSSSGGSSKK